MPQTSSGLTAMAGWFNAYRNRPGKLSSDRSSRTRFPSPATIALTGLWVMLAIPIAALAVTAWLCAHAATLVMRGLSAGGTRKTTD